MTVYVRFTDGSSQESYGVRDIEIRDGRVLLDKRSLPLNRIQSLSTRASSTPSVEAR